MNVGKGQNGEGVDQVRWLLWCVVGICLFISIYQVFVGFQLM
jgi:hypothetical protein